MPCITAVLSAICGTHFGETNEVASMTRSPASARRSISSILVAVGTILLLVLQPVARADFDDLDLGRDHGREWFASAPEHKIPAMASWQVPRQFTLPFESTAAPPPGCDEHFTCPSSSVAQ